MKNSIIKPKIFENSRGNKSSSIILEYLFLMATMILIGYSTASGKDIPSNTKDILRWIGVAIIFGVESYKINERICDIRGESEH
ncbi:MAG: hypothetical protein LBB13_00730 [Rickettsiales bacterium]|nr:hypothetical protein [Rickettsiales bacterium]